jgi:hypothetical protein
MGRMENKKKANTVPSRISRHQEPPGHKDVKTTMIA